jgi:hypothetical protein
VTQRPHVSRSIDELEALARAHWDDGAMLYALADELSNRAMPRAVALYKRLAEHIPSLVKNVRLPAHSSAEPEPNTRAARQPELPGMGGGAGRAAAAAPTPLPVPAPAPAPAPVVAPAPALATAAVQASLTASRTPAADEPAITLEGACRLLGVKPGTKWELIEIARRALVQESSPARTATLSAAQTEKLLERARLANAALAVLARARRS